MRKVFQVPTRDDWRVCRVSCLAGTDIRTSRSLHVDGRPEMNTDAKMKSEMREKRAMGIQGSRFSTFDLRPSTFRRGHAMPALPSLLLLSLLLLLLLLLPERRLQ